MESVYSAVRTVSLYKAVYVSSLKGSFNLNYIEIGVARGGVVVKALQTGRSWVRVSLEFFRDIILPVALWPWGRLSL